MSEKPIPPPPPFAPKYGVAAIRSAVAEFDTRAPHSGRATLVSHSAQGELSRVATDPFHPSGRIAPTELAPNGDE